ncbi:Dihydrofolate reductase [Eubacterium plexicaudatum ASF492]|uniref:dihydrofolate reductase n=1 Tax=Eubacterium plexicaudatum ASF492 TaxID=1235802 RepID=N2AFW8_9FIRM|nr:Dihydrofolate reductase [Eubacterium plexicaudatum ASF492]
MNLIVSADENWGIGRNNQLLVRIPDDLRLFRELTEGKVVVMGRKTRESLPNGILANRVNLVLTHDRHYEAGNAVVVHSMDELHRRLEPYPTDEVYVIGGGSVYSQLLDECSTAYVTKIEFAYAADAYAPNLDHLPEWELIAESEEQTYFDLIYYFRKYKAKGRNHGYNR